MSSTANSLIRLAVILFCLWLGNSRSEIWAGENFGPTDAPATSLTALLGELRQLRQAEQREREDWQAERSRLEILLQQTETDLDQTVKQTQKLEAETAKLSARRAELTARSEQLETQEKAASAWLREKAQKWLNLLKPHSLLVTPEILTKLAAVAGAESLSAQAEAFWPALQELAARGTAVEPESREITAGNETFLADTLRLGGFAAIWLATTGDRGGVGRPGPNGVEWQELAAPERAAIAEALSISRGEKPAALVRLPLPVTESAEK